MSRSREIVLRYIIDQQQLSNNPVEEMRLVEDLNFDSLDTVDLVIYIEDELDVRIDDDSNLRSCETMGDLITMLEEKYGLH